MTSIEHVTLEVADSAAAEDFYAAAFGLGDRLRVRASDAATSGFRGFTPALVVSQPSTVDSLVGTALDAGATALKPAKKGVLGLRRRRLGTGRDDLVGRDVGEEGHGAGQPGLALYSRRFAARDAGVSPEGAGSHRLAVGSEAGPFTDPDGFVWEAARVTAAR